MSTFAALPSATASWRCVWSVFACRTVGTVSGSFQARWSRRTLGRAPRGQYVVLDMQIDQRVFGDTRSPSPSRQALIVRADERSGAEEKENVGPPLLVSHWSRPRFRPLSVLAGHADLRGDLQIDLLIVLARWLGKKLGIVPSRYILESRNRHSAVIIADLLRAQDEEFDGLKSAMRSVAQETSTRVASSSVASSASGNALLFREARSVGSAGAFPECGLHIVEWALRFTGQGDGRWIGGVVRKTLVEEGYLAQFLSALFFNMDADSSLGENALGENGHSSSLAKGGGSRERPHLIVTSNVLVSPIKLVCWADCLRFS